MTDEIWKIIENYENYSVSNLGNVRNEKFDRILKRTINACGYLKVTLSKNGIKKIYLIHRLVALAFIENSDNKKYVDHIDNNRNNNNVLNLRWATHSENIRNSKIPITNTSGYKGVTFNKNANKWSASVCINSKNNHLGYFDTLEEAVNVRQTKVIEIYGEFVNECEK